MGYFENRKDGKIWKTTVKLFLLTKKNNMINYKLQYIYSRREL